MEHSSYILEQYRRGIYTLKETYLKLLKNAKHLYATGHLMLEEASACLDQITRFYEGKIDTDTLETYIGLVM